MSDQNKIGWGLKSYSYTHPIQKVAKDFQDRMDEVNGCKLDFQNMTKLELSNFAQTMVMYWNRCLINATDLPDDGKKPSEFPPIEDTTKQSLEHWKTKLNPS